MPVLITWLWYITTVRPCCLYIQPYLQGCLQQIGMVSLSFVETAVASHLQHPKISVNNNKGLMKLSLFDLEQKSPAEIGWLVVQVDFKLWSIYFYKCGLTEWPFGACAYVAENAASQVRSNLFHGRKIWLPHIYKDLQYQRDNVDIICKK